MSGIVDMLWIFPRRRSAIFIIWSVEITLVARFSGWFDVKFSVNNFALQFKNILSHILLSYIHKLRHY